MLGRVLLYRVEKRQGSPVKAACEQKPKHEGKNLRGERHHVCKGPEADTLDLLTQT